LVDQLLDSLLISKQEINRPTNEIVKVKVFLSGQSRGTNVEDEARPRQQKMHRHSKSSRNSTRVNMGRKM